MSPMHNVELPPAVLKPGFSWHWQCLSTGCVMAEAEPNAQDDDSERVMSMVLTLVRSVGGQAYASNCRKYSKRILWTKLKAGAGLTSMRRCLSLARGMSVSVGH